LTRLAKLPLTTISYKHDLKISTSGNSAAGVMAGNQLFNEDLIMRFFLLDVNIKTIAKRDGVE